MTLSTGELQACHYCVRVAGALLERDRPEEGIRRHLPALLDRLSTELEVSRSRRESIEGIGKLERDELITAAQAAAILGLSKRQVLRKARDLEGEKVGNSYVFKRSVVLAYKKAMGNHE